MKLKKLLCVGLATVMTMSLTACGNNASSNAVNGDQTGSKASGDTINLTIWSPTDEEPIENWWVEKLAAWNEAHPEIQVSREAIDRSDSYAYENKITTATTSNDLPDILYVDGPNVSYYAANGIIVPMEGAFSEEEMADFMPSTVQQGTYDGQLYAIAGTESSVALFYNKDYLDAAGIQYPSDSDVKDAWTWTEFYNNAEKLTTEDYVGTNIIMDKGEGLIYALGQFWTENNADLISEDGAVADGYVNSDASIATAEYLAKFIQNGYANLDPVKDEFLNGYAATMLGGSWNIADLEKSDMNWGVSYFPVSDDGKASSPTGDWAAAITKNCENVDAAKEFMNWLMSSENIAAYASAIAKPASRTSAYDQMEGWDEGARALMLWQLQNTGTARPSSPSYSVLSTDFASALLNIFSGADAKTEMDNVASDVDENYETYYAE
ncbi:MAG: sugar ABC transporter substrate-binding protein [Lachnospiraceae bacterium]|nr:sugar ABC transporter substrate-binding protein [Lachnospiraceae bacterium]